MENVVKITQNAKTNKKESEHFLKISSIKIKIMGKNHKKSKGKEIMSQQRDYSRTK